MTNVRIGTRKKALRWYDKPPPPTWTMEELIESKNEANTYLYKLLDYSEKESKTDEEVQKLRRDFFFLKNGPFANYFTAAIRCKMTSADALYALTSSLPAQSIATKFGVKKEKIKELRRGEYLAFMDEYHLIKRLTALIKARLKNDGETHTRNIYKVSELIAEDRYDDHFCTSSLRRAVALRKAMLTVEEYNKLLKKKTLDIMYPIRTLDLM